MKTRTLMLLLLCPLLSIASAGQSGKGPAGHWEGAVNVPSMELKVVIDLALDAGGQWIGDIDIPAQGAADLPLKGISVSGSNVSFALTAGPGNPRFQGKLSDDGGTLTGDFVQGDNTFPFTLKRTGEAKVSIPVKNAELPARFLGKWEGNLETPAGALRVIFNLDNKDGGAAGTIDSPDQGATGIPMNGISTSGASLKIDVRAVGGGYTGKLSEDGKTLTGEWTQGGGTLPLVLTRAVAKN